MPTSERPAILVIGSESLDNSYLGVRLELDGFKVGYLEFQDFVETSPEKFQDHFCLIDFQCKKGEAVVAGLEILAQLKGAVNPSRYALFNVCPDQNDQKKMFELIRQGLSGIFFDGENLEMVCRGVRVILEGETWFPRKLMMKMILGNHETSTVSSEQQQIWILTMREKEVLTKLATGLSNQDVAEQLFISIPTVKSHAKNIYAKIGVSSRLQAALWLAKNG